MTLNTWLISGTFSLAAAAAHVAIIFGGPTWYRFFGAGESMARMAEQKLLQPTLITAAIAVVLMVWGLFAWSAAGLLPRLPLLRLALLAITCIYLLRGLMGFLLPFISSHPSIVQNSITFWMWSSAICSGIGLVHLWGMIRDWSTL